MLKKEDFLQLSPLFILTITVSFTIYAALTNKFGLSAQHYVGVVSLVACYTLYFYNKRYFRYVTTATLILGTINLLAFTQHTSLWVGVTFFLGETSILIGVNPYPLVVLALFLFINEEKVNPFFADKPIPQEQAHAIDRRQVDAWKESYQDYAVEKLRQLAVTSGSLNEHAQQALKEVLAEKSSKK